jgi:protein-S-isoprenylcysteine O-methyltransferase Ste14
LQDWAAWLRVRLHFPLALVYLLLARPAPTLLASGLGVVLVGLLVRAWAAGHLHKESGVTVTGPYAHVRHPLYLGTILILAGFVIAAGSLWIAAMIAAFFIFFYLPVFRREEQERVSGVPDLYELYRALVPALIPRFSPARFRQPGADADRRFSFGQYRVNQEWQAAVGCAVLLLLLVGRMLLLRGGLL